MIKKWLFGVLALGGAVFFLAFLPFAMANHVPSAPSVSKCYDISGQGKSVKVAGTANSGVISFDQAVGSPLHEYEACVRNLTDTPDGPFRLEGWAWNSNLGWISFYCPTGAPGAAKNLGVDCSNAVYTGGYGVTIDKDGKFSGYAWGDNAGWISFKNVSNQVQIETANPDCQGFVYGSTKPKPACPSHESMPGDGAKMTHAWSDNVGWIDFDGISIPWFTIAKKITKGGVGTPASLTATPPSLPPPSPPALPTPKPNGVTVQVFPDPNAFIEDKTKAPIANDNGKYTVRINLFTVDGAPLTDERYSFKFEPKWQDTVKMDQTKSLDETGAKTDCNNKVYPDVTSTSAVCAVTKPLQHADFKLLNLETLGGPKESGIYTADIRAKAPTSLMNGIVKIGASFPYETFISPARKVEPNNLLLENIKITIVDKKTGESVFSQEVKPLARTGNLHFKPQAEITMLDDTVGKDIIKATINSESEFKLNSTGKGSAEFSLGFDDPASSSGITFKADKDETKFDFDGKSPLTQFKATPVLNEGAAIGAYIKSPYLYTTLVDGVTGAKYYSNKLPRVEGGYIINPVAIFRGNIYASGLTNPSISQVLRSLGDVSTNIVRSAIVSNVARITTGIKGSFSSGPVSINGFSKGIFTFASSTSSNVEKLLPDNAKNPTAYYVKNGDLIIDNGGLVDLTWTGARTFIVSGGNVYIKSNLYNGSSPANRSKLGIIVLKNLNAPANEQKKQGNVYIAPNVTNIQANIFADGSVFSYDSSKGICSSATDECNLGEPIFGSGKDSAQKVLEKNQLLIEGSVSSQNSVGGSLQDPPILGDGTKLSHTSKANVARARLYDLNFLRWYGGKIKTDLATGKEIFKPKEGGGPKYTKSDGSPCSGEEEKDEGSADEEDKGCDIFPPFLVGSDEEKKSYKSAFKDEKLKKKNLGAVYIYFDPPPANLPGFGVEAGAGQRQLQR